MDTLALDAPQRLGLAPPEAPATQSANASEELTGALGREAEAGMLIVTNGRDPATSGPYEIALEVLTAQVEADPAVAAVRQGPVSDDKRTTVLEVYFRDEDAAEQQRAVARIGPRLDPGRLRFRPPATRRRSWTRGAPWARSWRGSSSSCSR